MRTQQESRSRRSGKQGGKLLPALCNILGTLMLLAVIATYLPLRVPQWLGYEVYHVESGSMAPAIPKGSLICLTPVTPTQVAEGDVVAYRAGDSVIVHRVVQNRVVEGVLITRGDANTVEDPAPIPYADLIGRELWHLPLIGSLLAVYTGRVGKIYVLLFAASGLMFNLLAGRLRASRSEQLRRALAEELHPSEPLPETPAVPRKKRRKWIWIAVAALLLIFLGSLAAVLLLTQRYRRAETLYSEAADAYVAPAATEAATEAPEPAAPLPPAETAAVRRLAPITVDFAALQAENPDVVGWLYCEDTPINYPVLQGETNDSYLRTGFDGNYCYAGSIFLEASNAGDFTDDNTVIYGHNMRDGAMFACLEDWMTQSFYDEHPVLWLLTPERSYRVDLFSGYLTDAYAPAYRTSLPDAQARAEYLAQAQARSAFRANTTPPQQGCYVLLSTCAYTGTDARYVLHGVLVPLDG